MLFINFHNFTAIDIDEILSCLDFSFFALQQPVAEMYWFRSENCKMQFQSNSAAIVDLDEDQQIQSG